MSPDSAAGRNTVTNTGSEGRRSLQERAQRPAEPCPVSSDRRTDATESMSVTTPRSSKLQRTGLHEARVTHNEHMQKLRRNHVEHARPAVRCGAPWCTCGERLTEAAKSNETASALIHAVGVEMDCSKALRYAAFTRAGTHVP